MWNASDNDDQMARIGKADSAKGKAATPSSDSMVAWFFRPMMLLRAAIVVGIAALWPYLAQSWPILGGRTEYQLSFTEIEVIPDPERPVPEDFLKQVERESGLPETISVLDDRLTQNLAGAFGHHPWVSKVVRVQKSFPAKVIVELEYRRPVAVVQTASGRVVIDGDAVLLPSSDVPDRDDTKYPLIQAENLKPTVPVGRAWDNPSIIAAARLARLLHEKWTTLKLSTILVPREQDLKSKWDDIPLELIGQGGSKIFWGRAPGSDHPGELDPAQKVRRLENYLTEYGDYVRPNGPYEIDIRHWRENTRRPLVAGQSPLRPTRPFKDETRFRNSDARKRVRQ